MLSARIAVTVVCALLFAAPAAAQKLYKYVDSNGKVVYTDKPPIEATGKASEQLSPQGTVVKRNQAPLTAEQRAALAEESKRKAEEQIRAKEEKRKNEALLNTYSSEQDIDQARERALKANDATIKDTERKLAEAQKRQQQLKSETDFYQKKPVPAQLKREIQANENELKAHAELIEAKKRETDVIVAKYDEDKRRYLELIKAGAVKASPAPTATANK